MVTSLIRGTAAALFITGSIFAAEQFIAKKSSKTPSIGQLKEDCCEQLADAVKQVPLLLSQIASFQKEAVAIIEGYWQSDKSSFCQNASKEKLQQCSIDLKKLSQKTTALIADYQKIVDELKL